MEKRRLGTTDLDVSQICLGTMTWGEQNTEADGHAQLDHALANGINFVDTAEMYSIPPREETYGATESIIGTWFSKTGRRDDVILATKVVGPGSRFTYVRPDQQTPPGSGPRLTKASVLEACENSLKRLKTDYIDLYQVHWPDRAVNIFQAMRFKKLDAPSTVPLEETLEAMDILKQQGKIRHFGVSNETPWGVMSYLALAEKHGWPRVQSVQNPYSLLNRSYEVGGMAEISERSDVGLLAYSPLAFGVLSGKYRGGAKPAGARLTDYPIMNRYVLPRGLEATEKYLKLADDIGMDPSLMAYAFVNTRPFTTSTICGCTSTQQLDVAIKSAGATLDRDVIKAIDRIEDENPIPCP